MCVSLSLFRSKQAREKANKQASNHTEQVKWVVARKRSVSQAKVTLKYCRLVAMVIVIVSIVALCVMCVSSEEVSVSGHTVNYSFLS